MCIRDSLSEALRKDREEDTLLPEEGRFYLDERYILYAMGLLAQRNPKAALAIMKKCLKPLKRCV